MVCYACGQKTTTRNMLKLESNKVSQSVNKGSCYSIFRYLWFVACLCIISSSRQCIVCHYFFFTPMYCLSLFLLHANVLSVIISSSRQCIVCHYFFFCLSLWYLQIFILYENLNIEYILIQNSKSSYLGNYFMN
jgi:hypothetical protein